MLAQAKSATPQQWGELVEKRSTQRGARPMPTAPTELAGDLGIVGPPGHARGANPRVPEPVREAVFKIAKVGETYPEVVAADGKFYVVRLVSTTPARERKYEESERAIRTAVVQSKIREKEKALEEELKKKFPVTVDDAALAKMPMPPPNVAAQNPASKPDMRMQPGLGAPPRMPMPPPVPPPPAPPKPRDRAIRRAPVAPGRRERLGLRSSARAVRTAAELAERFELTPEEHAGALRGRARRACRSSSRRTTSALVDRDDPNCPIRRQVVPHADEATTAPGDLRDPLGEEAHEVAPELVAALSRSRAACSRPIAAPSTAASARAAAWSARAAARARSNGSRRRSRTCGAPRNPRRDRERRRSAGRWRPTGSSAWSRAFARSRASRRFASRRACPSCSRSASRTSSLDALRPHHPLWVMTHFNHPKELTELARAALRSASPTPAFP